MSQVKFKPRLLPRSLRDALLTLAVGVVQASVLGGLPVAAAFWVSGKELVAREVAIAVCLVFLSFSVSSLVVSADGVRLVRWLGRPKFVPWSEVVLAGQASSGELILHGWLWPLFPAREMTTSFTSTGHYRIQYGKQWFYFPPADPKPFIAAIREHARGA